MEITISQRYIISILSLCVYRLKLSDVENWGKLFIFYRPSQISMHIKIKTCLLNELEGILKAYI